MNQTNNNRNTAILAAILLFLGFTALSSSPALVVLILLGLLFLVRQFDNYQLSNQGDSAEYAEGDYYYDDDDEYEQDIRSSRQAQTEPVYRHALEAVTRAGLNPDEVKVLAVDVGVIAFTPDGQQTVYRTWSLPDDVDYIQPFVQLRLPSKALGRVKFEILDGNNQPVFAHEDPHSLERGRNFISPSARLPIHDERHLDGRWQLRVTADDVLLAVHQFSFAEAGSIDIERHLGEDGEMNTELRAAMAESKLPKMSLDDLLAYQDEEEQRRQGRSS